MPQPLSWTQQDILAVFVEEQFRPLPTVEIRQSLGRPSEENSEIEEELRELRELGFLAKEEGK